KDGCSDPDQVMPAAWLWPFPLGQYNFDLPNRKRIAWGMTDGSGGSRFVTTFRKGASGRPFPKYSGFFGPRVPRRGPGVSLGAASRRAAGRGWVAERDDTADAVLRATIGSVPTTGPGGIGGDEDAPLVPAGYDKIYGSWLIDADNNAVEVQLTLPNGPLHNPL